MSLKLFVCVFVSCFALTVCEADGVKSKLNISVYYESLCPDSAKFINQQLAPVLIGNNTKLNTSISYFINVTFVPYGKSSYNINEDKKYSFSCHHGPQECEGNKYQACAIKEWLHVDAAKTYAFINCTMRLAQVNKTTDYATQVVKTCSNDNDLATLKTCAEGIHGDELLLMYANMTEDVMKSALKSVPTVVFNNVYSEDKSTKATANLIDAVCEQLSAGMSSSTFAECENSKNSVTTLTSSFLMVVVTTVLASMY